MDELKKAFSPLALKHLEELIPFAKKLDAEIPAHMLIVVNEEGFMEKKPGPKAFVQKWMEEYANRKQFYAEEETLIWLKGERDRELKHLKNTTKTAYQTYYRLLLGLISTEIRAISSEKTEDGVRDRIQELIKSDQLREAMDELASFFERKDTYADAEMELIMHQASLTELMKRHRENTLDDDDYFRQKAQIRKAILSMLSLL